MWSPRRAAKADRLMTKLSDLLRMTLETSTRDEVRLGRELEVLRLYSALMHERFAGRLGIEVRVDERLADVLVPTLILQILVENAVRHGTSERSVEGRIEVEAGRLPDGLLQLRVGDNGRGSARTLAELKEKGSGLANVQERLLRVYGSRGRLETGESALGGFLVTVTLPERLGRAGAYPDAATVSDETS